MLEEFGRLFADCGALEPVAGGPGGGTAPAGGPVLTFLSRTARAADGEPSGAARAVAMAGSAVLVISPAAAGEPITADLAETGVGLTATAEDCDLLTAEQWLAASSARRGAIAVFDDPHADGAPEKLAEAVAQCHRYGLPLLRFSSGSRPRRDRPPVPAGRAGVRPVFPVRPAGHDLAGRSHRRRPGRPRAGGRDLVTGLVTAHLLALMSDLAAPAPPRTLSRMTWPGYQLTSYDVVPEPDCAPAAGWPATTAGGPHHSGVSGRSGVRVAGKRRTGRTRHRSFPRRSSAHHGHGGAAQPDDHRAAHSAGGQLARAFPAGHPGDPQPAARLAASHRGRRHRANGPSQDDLTRSRSTWSPTGRAATCPARSSGMTSHERRAGGDRRPCVPEAAAEQHRSGHGRAGFRAGPGRGRGSAAAPVRKLRGPDGSSGRGCAAIELPVVAARCGRRVSFASCWSGEVADLLELEPSQQVIAAVTAIHPSEEA